MSRGASAVFGWFKSRKRRKLLAEPFPDAWREWLAPLPFYASLVDQESARLRDILRVIVAEKRWEGCGGLSLTPEMPVVIAAQAALLVLEIEHDYYARVPEILVYPAAYQAEHGDARAGEAWYRGPIVLSWDQTLSGAENPDDGFNVVLHEFAHKLDMLDGVVDGTPPLHARDDYPRWQQVMTAAFEDLKELARKGRRSVLDPYGTTNEGEFFAVATEAFFEKSLQLERKRPELYALLRDYYRQDPAERVRRMKRTSS